METTTANTVETSLNNTGFFSVGLYNTTLAPEVFFDQTDVEGEEEVEKFWDSFDMEKYKAKLTECAQIVLTEEVLPELEKYGITAIKAGKFISPNFYNYSTDNLNLDITISENTNELIVSALMGLPDFEKWLKKTHSDRPGYWSFIETDYEYFLDILLWSETDDADDYERCFAVALQYLTSEMADKWDEAFYYECSNNINESDVSEYY